MHLSLRRAVAVVIVAILGIGGTQVPAGAGTVGSIRGTVVDVTTEHPIAGAQVALISSSGVYNATTDAHGFFSIVGIRPSAYAITAQAAGYNPSEQPSITISQDSNLSVILHLSPHASANQMRTIAVTSARNSTFPVQQHQPDDVYVVGVAEIAQLGGLPGYENEGLLLNTLPGVSPIGGSSGGYLGSGTSIRGGLANDTGYQLEGLNATDPLTGYFMNNLVLNGAQSVNLTDGPGDASKGGSGAGFVNIITKTGTYPSTGYLQADVGGPAFEHNLIGEYGTATADRRYSLYVSGRYDREFGGCCAPPYGSVYGDNSTPYPDIVGQSDFQETNDTVANGLIHFGKDNANTIQLWGEWGANAEIGGHGIDAATYPFASAIPAYVNVYQQTPLLLAAQAQEFGLPVTAQVGPLSVKQAQALMPFYPGQTDANQAIGSSPSESTTFDLLKLGYSRALGSRGFLTARLYRTQNGVVDNFNDPNNSLFGYGLPSQGFSDTFVTRASQNTGIGADLQEIIGEHHTATFGVDYRYSNENLSGFLPSPSLFFAGPTVEDFLQVNPFPTIQNPQGGGAPGLFAGQRYPALNFTMADPMHVTSLYATDNWTVNDRFVVQPGLRYDQQKVPTGAGTYEANQLQPRIYATLTTGRNHDTVIRGGYGHAATFAPLIQIENQYNAPAAFASQPATQNICGGVNGNFSQPCANYRDELQNAWWRYYGVNPYSFSGPQQSDTYEISLEHAFPGETGLKVTFFNRRDYNVIVNSQHVTIAPNGAVIPGTTSVTNDGRAQTAGVELQLSRQIVRGLSMQLNGTYINQFVNYLTPQTPAFRPTVEPALLASGAMFHPSYISPFTGALTLDYNSHGWRVDPIFQYISGYPVGVWQKDPIFVNGQPVFVPNTNLYGGFGSQYCYYVDPQNPGTPGHPHIIGSTGGGCTSQLNGALTHSILFTNLVISRQVTHRILIGVEVQNLLNNTANYPYFNPGYVNNGFGGYAPGSGTNPVSGPGTVATYPPGPFLNYPSGPGRQITVFSRFSI